METADLLSLLEDLEENIDDLEENLEPLLTATLSVTTKKLPLLDRAKLYTMLVYSIESLLFSYLRLNGIQAKEHAVYKELTRVKQYFAKIKLADQNQNPTKPTLSLNKQATGRFIKAALAGNDKLDTERAERNAREKLLAARKLKALEELRRAESGSSEQSQSLEDGEVNSDAEMVDAPAAEPVQNKSGKERREEAKANGTYLSNKAKKRANGTYLSKGEKKRAKRMLEDPKADGSEAKKARFMGAVEQELVKPG